MDEMDIDHNDKCDIFGEKPLTMDEYQRRKGELYSESLVNGYRESENSVQNDIAFEPLISQEQRLTNYQKGIVGLIRHREKIDEVNAKIPDAEKLSPGEVKDMEGKIHKIKEIPHPELLAVSYRKGRRGAYVHPVVATLPNGREMVYANVTAAARQLNLMPGSISRCCRGLMRQTGGIRFRYVELRDKIGVIDEYIADMEAGLIEQFTAGEGESVPKQPATKRAGRPRKKSKEAKKKKAREVLYDEDGNVLKRGPGRPRKDE